MGRRDSTPHDLHVEVSMIFNMTTKIDIRPIVVIINEGAKASQDLEAEALCRAFAAHDREVQIRRVAGAQISENVRAAVDGGARIIVAAGGDGTVNAVAAELVSLEDVALAVLPVGTLNHFAGDLGMPEEIGDAVAVIAAGRTRQVDVGEVNGRIFLNNSSLGLYARLVVERERLQRHTELGKWPAMARATWSVLRDPNTFSVLLHAEGRELRRRTPFVFIGNNDYAIEGPHAGERSCLDGGVLAIYVLRPLTPWGLAMLAFRALTGHIASGRDLDKLRATSLVVESNHSGTEVARDGEVGTFDMPLRYRIRPGALRVIAPLAGATF